MIEKKTFLNSITVDHTGHILIQYKKAIVEDGKILSYEYHRTSVEPGGNVNAQLAGVDSHLPQMGFPPCTDEPGLSALKRQDVTALAAQVHTPAVINAHNARKGQRP